METKIITMKMVAGLDQIFKDRKAKLKNEKGFGIIGWNDLKSFGERGL